MKILFIDAVDTDDKGQTVLNSIGIYYLISYARKYSDVKIDCKVVRADIEMELVEFKPDLVGISCVSENYNAASEYAKMAKSKRIPVIIGGIHISMIPQTLRKEMDIGVIGEGEQTFLELVEHYEKNGNFKNVENINGLVYWSNGQLKFTKPRELIDSLDKIPFPARDLMEVRRLTNMFSSRGCPYYCSFCSSSRFWKKVRFSSARHVVDEIKELKEKYNVNHISFYDDLFIADKKRLKEIAEILEKEDLLDKLSFDCNCRANLVDEETMRLLKKMNFTTVAMGLESGCEKRLAYLKGGSVKVSDNKKAVELANKYGIEVTGNIVIGLPFETREDILETLNFVKSVKMGHLSIWLLTPLPQTPVWSFAEEKGLIKTDVFNWSSLKLDFSKNYEDAIVLSQTLTRKELFDLFMQFKKEQRMLERKHMIKTALNPRKTLRFITNRL